MQERVMPRGDLRKVAAVAGIVGPALFSVVVTTLSILQYPFMRSLGWDPVSRPTFDWPSGLALGPFGWIMTITFILSGLLMSAFAWGLRSELCNDPGQIGTILLTWAGVAMMALAFPTDRTISLIPVTWHSRLHDLAFLALGLMLIPAMILFGMSFRRSARWKDMALFTWLAAALAIPTFAFKGIVFYGFLAAMLAWNLLTAIRLYRAA